MAEVRRKEKQPNDALSLYERALVISPEDAPAYFYRGTLLLQQGDEEKAIASFKLAHQFADTPNIIKKTHPVEQTANRP